MYYIEESDKPKFFEEIFSRVKLETDKIILPVNIEKINSKKAKILASKTLKILEKANSKKV